MELYRKVRLACRDGMSERGRAPLRGLMAEREEDASVFGPAGLQTHGAGAASEARRVCRADRAVASGRSPPRLSPGLTCRPRSHHTAAGDVHSVGCCRISRFIRASGNPPHRGFVDDSVGKTSNVSGHRGRFVVQVRVMYLVATGLKKNGSARSGPSALRPGAPICEGRSPSSSSDRRAAVMASLEVTTL